MELTFYIAGAVAVISTAVMLTRLNVVHALLYLIVSLLGVAVEFLRARRAICRGARSHRLRRRDHGALSLRCDDAQHRKARRAKRRDSGSRRGFGSGPVILASILIVEVVYLARGASADLGTAAVGPKEVGIALFGPYMIGVELASMLLLAGLVGAYHLGFRKTRETGDST